MTNHKTEITYTSEKIDTGQVAETLSEGVLKYLKKKGIPTNYRDMDLIVEKIILKIDGVQKVGDGMYLSNN